jgi:DNA-3-methyladenine glycosylase II
MKRIIARVGPCTLAPRRDYFVALCRSIYAQQISTRIATLLFDRFSEHFPRRRPTPARVVELLSNGDETVLKRCGLSRQKKAYILDLARHFVSGEIPTRSFAGMSDEEVIETLTRVNGIGRWTAEMFLIFVLNREDVLPVDDLGVREAAKLAYGLPERPGARELTKLGEPWRPYRSVATWYLWRSLAVTKKD